LCWTNLTAWAGEGEEQNDVDKMHDKVTIIVANIPNNAVEYAKEDGNLGNHIEIMY
jgi:signal transduction histidine kinase